jgi:hypothetical protein
MTLVELKPLSFLQKIKVFLLPAALLGFRLGRKVLVDSSRNLFACLECGSSEVGGSEDGFWAERLGFLY